MVPAFTNSALIGIFITPTDDGAGVGIDSVQVKIKKTLAVGSKLFARLKVVSFVP